VLIYFSIHTGDVLVVLDLRPDETLFEAGVAREVMLVYCYEVLQTGSLFGIYSQKDTSCMES
jgi:hypothetical protein